MITKLASALVGRIAAAWTACYRSLYKGARPADLRDHTRDLAANLREPGRPPEPTGKAVLAFLDRVHRA